MNFFSIDQHISVIADIRYILNQLGHTVREISLSGHSSIVGRPIGNVPELNNDNWCNTISQRKFDSFYNTYKKDLDKYDGFICCYPPIFSMLYQLSNKPIIIQIPIRYECGAEHNIELWEEFNKFLQKGIDDHRIFLCANNLYDKKYAEGFLDRPVRYIPSLCEYTGMSYNPVYDMFLYFGSFRIKEQSGRMIYKHDAMKAGHAWQNIADFKGCIHYPYNVSTMSIFEQYTANIPLFFPTKRYLMEMFLDKIPILHQLSWQQQGSNGIPKSQMDNSFQWDPNNFSDFNCISNWLDYADFYSDNMKCIRYFDDLYDRNEILNFSKDTLLSISNEMKEHNKKRKSYVYNEWYKIMDEIICL